MRELAEGMYRLSGEGALSVLERVRELEHQGKNVYRLEIGQPDFPTPIEIKKAGVEAIEKNQTEYVATGGMQTLKEAIQDEIETTRGFRPSLGQILVLPGAKPGIFFSIVATCSKGDEVILPDPGFPTYGSVCDYVGAKSVTIRLKVENDFRITPDEVASRITPRTKLILLNSPHNPTGSVMTKKDMEQVAELARENDCFILADEIYSKLVYDTEFFSPSLADESKEMSIIVDGFSKSYSMTGWRLGYVVGPERFMEKLGLLFLNALTCTAPFVQIAGITALKGSQDGVQRMLQEYRTRRDLIVKGLNEVSGFSCYTPSGAFYAWPNIMETGMTSQEVATLLLEKGSVAALPGTAFGENGEGYLRFSYATSKETIHAALERVKALIEEET
ncbi:MAG: pyridoxal phosphate-dependent aminotransferase [Candidatus Thorarchaeota archaeon]|nr:MAG: pyridoxal phosphate-dependent aminotransferase [Candidatus Thorarchaeota archaeon]